MNMLQQADVQAREQLRSEIRQSINAARDAARDAAREAGQNATRVGGRGENVIVLPPQPPTPPGFTIHQSDNWDPNGGMPPQIVDIAVGFFIMCSVMVIGWPIARAFGRRIEGRSTTPAALNPQVTDQLQRIEQAVEAMSIEVERISESQRFLAKLQSQNAERATFPSDRS